MGSPNPSGIGMRFNFSSPLDMGRVTGKYVRIGYGDGEGKTCPPPRPIAMPINKYKNMQQASCSYKKTYSQFHKSTQFQEQQKQEQEQHKLQQEIHIFTYSQNFNKKFTNSKSFNPCQV